MVLHLIFDVFFLERDVFNDFTVTMTEVEFENEWKLKFVDIVEEGTVGQETSFGTGKDTIVVGGKSFLSSHGF